MSEYIVKLPTYGAADEFFKTHEMPDMTLYGYPLTGEIVRCRDCRYYEDTGNCTWFECSLCWLLAEVTSDGFCAWGERREQ